MPQCRETQVEIHHIDDYAKVQEHTFDNPIALCANCRQRLTRARSTVKLSCKSRPT
ncbi:MAG: HNH endonuclease [Acidimicrobiales bacterium]